MLFNPPPLPRHPRRILLVRLSANGDVVQSFEVLRAMRHRWPEAYIGWVVGDAAAPLAEVAMPWLNALHVLPGKAWSRGLKQSLLGLLPFQDEAITRVMEDIRAQGYEIAIDIQGLNKSALVGVKAGIPIRVGFSDAREQATLAYTHTPAKRFSVHAPQGHAIDEFLQLLSPWEAPQHTSPPIIAHLPLRAIDAPLMEMVQQVKRLKETQGKQIYALAPFTMWESKHWPAAHWQTLILRMFEDEASPRIGVCIGAPGDTKKWEAILAPLPLTVKQKLVRCDGKTSFTSLIHLLSHVDGLIGSDSAPLHLVDWLQREGLNPHAKACALLGPTHALRTGPYGTCHAVITANPAPLPCQPCHKRACPLGTTACMHGIAPSQVVASLPSNS
jgi:heptosyltransferase I